MNCSWWSVEDEFLSLTTGKKLLCSLVVGQRVLMYIFLDGSRQQHLMPVHLQNVKYFCWMKTPSIAAGLACFLF